LVSPASVVTLAVERAVERGEHAALGESKAADWRSRGAAGRSRSPRRASGPRAHHDDAVGEHQRLIDVVVTITGWAWCPPRLEQVVLQVGAGESVERRERLVDRSTSGRVTKAPRDGDALRLPPDSSRGHTFAWSVRPTRSSCAFTRALRSGRGRFSSPKPTLCATKARQHRGP